MPLTVMPQAQYPDEATPMRLSDQFLNAVRVIPGLQQASISTGFPIFAGAGATLYARADQNVPPIAERKGAPSNDISPGWFQTLGIPLIAGREFDQRDRLDRPNVVVISALRAK